MGRDSEGWQRGPQVYLSRLSCKHNESIVFSNEPVACNMSMALHTVWGSDQFEVAIGRTQHLLGSFSGILSLLYCPRPFPQIAPFLGRYAGIMGRGLSRRRRERNFNRAHEGPSALPAPPKPGTALERDYQPKSLKRLKQLQVAHRKSGFSILSSRKAQAHECSATRRLRWKSRKSLQPKTLWSWAPAHMNGQSFQKCLARAQWLLVH